MKNLHSSLFLKKEVRTPLCADFFSIQFLPEKLSMHQLSLFETRLPKAASNAFAVGRIS